MQRVELQVVCGGRLLSRRPLDLGQRVVCGRGAAADLHLEEPEASRAHLSLERRAGELLLTDLGSRNGTRLGSELLPSGHSRSLAGPARLFVGQHELRVVVDGLSPAPLREDYEPLRELGRGATARVHLARERASGRQVAIKTFQGQLVGEPSARARFLREARVRIDSPFVVGVLDARDEQGSLCLVLELVEGEDLDQRLAAGPLPLRAALRLARELAHALAAAHAAGVVHRDVKPANVLLARDGRALLADFGIAKLAYEGSLGGLTESGLGLGTPLYVAPEQAIDAKRVTPAADLYGLGATLFHALAGRPPFLSGPRFFERLLDEPAPPLSGSCPDAPPALGRLLARLLAKEPEDRPASAALVGQKLSALAQAAGLA